MSALAHVAGDPAVAPPPPAPETKKRGCPLPVRSVNSILRQGLSWSSIWVAVPPSSYWATPKV